MNGKLIGTAVGMALENREAIKDMSAPARNVGAGAAQVIFSTLWKSTVVGVALIFVWVAAFAFTSVLIGPTFLVSPVFTFLFGVSLFMLLPAIIGIRESRKVSKAVSIKNAKAKEMLRIKRAQQEAEWQAQAEFEAQQQAAMMAWHAAQQGQNQPVAR